MNKLGAWIRTRYWLLGLALAVLITAAVAAIVFLKPGGGGPGIRVLIPDAAPSHAPVLPKLVVTFRDRAPDIVVYSKGRHSGPLRYVLEEAAGRIGYAIEWKPATFSKSLAGLVDGSVDVVPYVFARTAERERDTRYSVSLGLRKRPVYLAVQKARPLKIESLEDLAGHTVGYLQSGYYFAELHTTSSFTPVPYADDRSLVKAFVDGAIEIMAVSNKETTERVLASVGYNDFKYADLVFDKESDMYFLYSRSPRRQEVFDRLDQALLQMKKEGLITDIYHSFDADPPR